MKLPIDMDRPDDPFAYLLDLEKFGIKFGLENIQAICEALANPQHAYRSVIVAGTNGKGSVTAMADTALRAAGYRCGRYTSPHLLRVEERFVIEGEPVATATLAAAIDDVRTAIEELRNRGRLATHPTFFEVTTAVAFELFRRALIDVAVLEVGLGGRFDATNVASPMAAAITSIDLDHQLYLGHTIPEIAFEKAGVIKPGMTVVLGETKREAVAVMARVCRERNATLVRAHDGVEARAVMANGRTSLDLTTPAGRYLMVPLALRGRHQVANAVVTVRLLEVLDTLGLDVPHHAIVRGLADVAWRGRLELVDTGDGRAVLLDAAHNPAGARALAAYLRETYPRGLPIVFGVMRDKDAGGMMAALAPSATRVILTQPSIARAATPDDLAPRVRPLVGAVPLEVVPDPRAALERAWTVNATACATGSIFLLGDVLGWLEGAAVRAVGG